MNREQDEPFGRMWDLCEVIVEQLEVLSQALRNMPAASSYPAPRLPRGRRLTPKHEELARHTALSDIEQSDEPVAERARMWRNMAHNAVAERQYVAAGLFRRTAEIQEDWPLLAGRA